MPDEQPPGGTRSWSRRFEPWGSYVLASVCLAGLAVGTLGGNFAGRVSSIGLAYEALRGCWTLLGWFSSAMAAIAWLRRLRWQAMCFTVAAAGILIPEFWHSLHRSQRGSPDGPRLRVASVNLCAENEHTARMVHSIHDLDADVLVMPEFTDYWEQCLSSAFANDYPHRWLASPPRRDGYAIDGLRLAIWSRLPGEPEPEVLQLGGYRSQLKVRLHSGSRSVAVFGIHPAKPFPLSGYRRAAQDWDDLVAWIRSEPGPLIVAGDFNAVPNGYFLGRLTELGLISAAEAVRGRAPGTWPSTLPEALRIAIDHVMFRGPISARDFRIGLPTGSDHAAVCASLVWNR